MNVQVGISRAESSPHSTSIAADLLLRFLCPNCERRLTVPMRSLGIEEECPGCRKRILIPTLDETVTGFQEAVGHLRGFVQPTMWGTECPNCERPIWVSLADLSRSFHCSECGTWLHSKVQPNGTREHIDFGHSATDGSKAKPLRPDVATESRIDDLVPPEPSAPPHNPRIHESAIQERAAGAQASPSPQPDSASSSPPTGNATHDSRLAASPFAGYEPEQSQESSAEPPDIPESNIAREAKLRAGSALSPRLVRIVILYGLWLGPIVFILSALAIEGAPAIGIILTAIFLALPWYWWSPWFIIPVMRAVLVAMFPTFRCPGCQEPHPLCQHA